MDQNVANTFTVKRAFACVGFTSCTKTTSDEIRFENGPLASRAPLLTLPNKSVVPDFAS